MWRSFRPGYACGYRFSVSPLQFLHSDFSLPGAANAMARDASLDPKLLLELIVTENTVMRNRPEVATQMRSLAGLGVHFSVADFGSSYSCLSHLHQLPRQHAQDRLLLCGAHHRPQWDLYHCSGHCCVGSQPGDEGGGRRSGARRPDGVPACPRL